MRGAFSVNRLFTPVAGYDMRGRLMTDFEYLWLQKSILSAHYLVFNLLSTDDSCKSEIIALIPNYIIRFSAVSQQGEVFVQSRCDFSLMTSKTIDFLICPLLSFAGGAFKPGQPSKFTGDLLLEVLVAGWGTAVAWADSGGLPAIPSPAQPNDLVAWDFRS